MRDGSSRESAVEKIGEKRKGRRQRKSSEAECSLLSREMLDEPVHVHVVGAEVQGDQELEGESPGRVGHSQEGQKTSGRASGKETKGRKGVERESPSEEHHQLFCSI